MKYINKLFKIFLIILMCIPSIFYAPPVEAKTIADLRKELDSVRLLFTPEILHVYRNLSEKDLKSLIKIKEQQTIIKNLEAKVAYIKRLADEYLCKLIKLQSNYDS